MDVSSIVSLARTLTHTDSNQITDADAMTYLNLAYKRIANVITSEIDEDYFWDIFDTDTFANQSEYVLPIGSATLEGFKKIQRVELKYKSTDTYRTLVESDTLANYTQTVDRLEDNVNTSKAFYDLKDGSIFVYPAPTEAVTGGLRINVTITLKDLLITDLEASVFPQNSELRDYHELLSIGMKQYIYSQQGLINEKNDSINEFNVKVEQMIDTLKDRYSNPVITQLPNSTSLKY